MKKTKLTGPLYRHLGHFRQQKYVDAGHNTGVHSDDKGKVDKYGRRDEGYKLKVPDQEEARRRRRAREEWEEAHGGELDEEAKKSLDREQDYITKRMKSGASEKQALSEWIGPYEIDEDE